MPSRVANINNVFNGVVDQLRAQPGRKDGAYSMYIIGTARYLRYLLVRYCTYLR